MTQILISGYYGFGNSGDEAVLGGILTGLHEELPDVRPVVLSGDTLATEALHGVAAIPRMDRQAIRAELRHTDLLISGGGSLLQDVTSARSPLYYLGVLWYAQRLAVPTMLLAQGVGPLKRLGNRLLTRAVLNRARAITVRDQASAELLHRLGIDVPPVEVTADTSFLLTPNDSPRVQQWWETYMDAGRPVIVAALRPWRTRDAVERYTAIADSLATLAQESGAMILYAPMQHDMDVSLAREMSAWTPVENRVLEITLTPCEMLALVQRCHLVLAMRLHALIFAVHRLIPAVGITYDPKVRDFARAAHLPATIDWEALTPENLTEALFTSWQQRADLHATLQESCRTMSQLARWNFTRVKELLNNTSGE